VSGATALTLLAAGCAGAPDAAAPPPAPTASPTVLQVADPVRVRVPRLGIRAALDPLGLGKQGELIPPRYGRAGWYEDGPEPGERGRAVIAGHVDSKTGPDVFARLREARKGDRVLVDLAGGGRLVFTVQRARLYPVDAFPTTEVYGGPRTAPELRLITCGGPYDRAQGRYRANLVVYARPA
jgi:LPXTG-site transpeptidase (sortase) family protein